MHAEYSEGLIPNRVAEMAPRALLDRDCLLLAIESSIKVRAHAHFFSWVQGALQAILPHEVLLCAAFDHDGATLYADILAVRPLSPELKRQVLRPDGGLLARLAALWQQRGRTPIVLRVDVEVEDVGMEEELRQSLRRIGVSSIAAHGTLAPDGSMDAFFGFADVTTGSPEEVMTVVEIILPHLRAALVRMQERCSPVPVRTSRGALTVREREVLLLLQHGRSNAEIGGMLSISPLTVKNHVQKLLRKLGVRNRTQAVALDVTRRWHSES